MKNLKIIGYGKAVPDRIVTNNDLSKFMDTNDEWIRKRTGIKQRHISDVGVSSLATEAAKMAISNANIKAEDIDLIICSTVTPDYITPSTACMVQKNLGISDKMVMAMDVNAACTGFIFAFKTAAALLNSFHKKALVIGAETVSRILDFSDRSTSILFADAAGAIILEKNDLDNEMFFYTNCRGDEDFITLKGFESNENMNNKEIKTGHVEMKGDEVFKFAIRAHEDAILNVLEQSHYKLYDIKLIIPHQANYRILEGAAKRIHCNMDKFFTNLDRYGNTSSASIPLAMCEAHQMGLFKENDKIILAGFGGGLTWGGVLIEV